MESRVALQPAYVLHSQPFQNTSLLVDFFTMDYGRVRAVAKGARSAKSKYRSLLQLFQPLLVSLSGRGELKTLTGLESSHSALNLNGQRLFSGMYINELLTRLLMNHVEHKQLYLAYQDTLAALQGEADIQLLLRQFELCLLSELGYGINLDSDCHSHEPIDVDQSYRFTPDIGFQAVADETQHNSSRVFLGAHIVALREHELTDTAVVKTAKRLLRTALAAHLGGKPLHSRSLFAK
ncbi:MAG: DNA repair protein RecO [Pseudohongiella sp.]|nr:MAG: DNA repair protein RecO [Pseudohongiella sp.]